jgi:carboxymethylenebutenolidase
VRIGKTGLVDSIIIAHPGPFTIDDVKAIKVPACWICAEEDHYLQEDKRLQCEAIFASRKDKPDYVDYEFRLYKDTAHGFASRPNLNLPEIKDAWEGAFQQTVDWFKKTLVV